MKEIENRMDIFLLVTTFYKAVRRDPLLGPVFNAQIKDKHWPDHLDKLTDFWMTNLFGIIAFKGNPTQIHRKLDKTLEYGMEQNHFEQWLFLWFVTIDSLFEGKLAQRAKDGARKMATGQYTAILRHRPEQLS